MNQEYDLCGIILKITYLGNTLSYTNDWSFKIKCFNTDNVITVLCHYYCPAKVRDCIYTTYQPMIKDEKEQYYMIKPPMVMIGKDKEAIILNLIKCLTIDYKKALLFYNHLYHL